MKVNRMVQNFRKTMRKSYSEPILEMRQNKEKGVKVKEGFFLMSRGS